MKELDPDANSNAPPRPKAALEATGAESADTPTSSSAPELSSKRTADEVPPPGETDLALDGEIACDLLSDHGGEIVITDDGRIVFMNASAHLVELAAALDPDNADIQARLRCVQDVNKKSEDATDEASPEEGLHY